MLKYGLLPDDDDTNGTGESDPGDTSNEGTGVPTSPGA